MRIIVLELLIISIRNNRQIRVIKVNGNESKLVTFPGDMTALISVINLFGTYSDLKINHQRTEVLLLGNKEVAVRNFELEGTEFKKTFKILGLHFVYNFTVL